MNKPVAWWTGEFNDEADDFMFDKTKQNHINHVNSRTHEFFRIPLYTHPANACKHGVDDGACKECYLEATHPAELTDEEIIESLAELEHEQWMKWADTIMQTEKISDSRFARWASCMIPYAELSEEMKEHDRVWARQASAILRKAQEK